jgi:UDP-N-acetylmuramoylalanine--D-glutamate ligase
MGEKVIDKKKVSREYRDKKVLVLGIGILGGGFGVARFFAELGAKVTATDLRNEIELDNKQLNKLRDLGVRLILGEHKDKDILNADLIIRNPGVPKKSRFLKLADDNNVPISMDAALFAKLCPLPIIGITGTRGKTTTTNMLATILKNAGHHVLVAGNIPGKSTLSLLWKLKKDSKVILELSSWALQGFEQAKISPSISVITNIYPDHLNRYGSMDEYVLDKESIFKYQSNNDVLVLNRHNQYSKQFAQEAKSKIQYFYPESLSKDFTLQIPGEHNKQNAAAAFAVARVLGVDEDKAVSTLKDFTGVPYRQQLIRKLNGVTFINDTTSTTPTATIAALRAFQDKSLILILGGASKNLPLDELVRELSQSSVKKYVLLSGDGTEELIKEMKHGDKHIIHADLEKAVHEAYKSADDGDYILFSPGFTSFATFKNEFDRGDQFNKIVNAL